MREGLYIPLAIRLEAQEPPPARPLLTAIGVVVLLVMFMGAAILA